MIKKEEKGLYFLPLGGADDIGMNMYAYGCNGKWIVVDTGYGFLQDEYPGMDMCYASPEFLTAFENNIEGIFITHAHEDHMGAIAHIWQDLKCPIYATSFAMALIRERLKEFDLQDEPSLNVVSVGDCIKTEAFEVEFVALVHSVPQTCGLYIKTAYGNIFHATDWRFDDGKLSMLPTNLKRLKEIGQEGVLMFVADSTNILIDKAQPSEAQIRENLLNIIPQISGGIIITCFASNLMRLESIVLAADKAGRTPVIIGKSLVTNLKSAKECGYFADLPKVYKVEQVQGITADKALYICTGSQANYRSALTTIANGESKYITLSRNDTVIFSSKIIPGNEKKIEKMQDNMRALGVNVITEKTHPIHTSGHCSKEEIKKMYEILQPQIVFPVHGDKDFITEHLKFAQTCGIKQTCSGQNGDVFLLADGKIQKIEEVISDVMAIDRGRCISLTSDVVRKRRQIAYNCCMFITVVISKNNEIADLQISSPDILEEKAWDEMINEGRQELISQLNRKLAEAGGLTAAVKDTMRGKIRRYVAKKTDVKPLTIMHIYKLED